MSYCEDCDFDGTDPEGPHCRPCLKTYFDTGESPGWHPKATPDASEDAEYPPEATQDASEGDSVSHPGHYTSLPLEAIKSIRLVLTEAYGEKGFEAYCFGNEMKYRFRAGFKGDPLEDIQKALKYREFRLGGRE